MAAYTAIDDPSAYFKIQLFTGTASSNAITFDDTDTDMQPDMVWIKSRSGATDGVLYDAVRGVTEMLRVSGNHSEGTQADGLTAFGSDGFTVGADSKSNGNTETMVAWCWKESATSGFDIVTYTGNATDDTDISHNLSAVPHLIIVKNLGANEDWNVYHQKNTSAPETDYLQLNINNATADAADRWSDEVPTSSVFTIGDNSDVNQDATGYVAYCFAEKQGYSKFGGYTGNGNADGVFNYTGFRPAYLMIKRTDDVESWLMMDNKRLGYNPNTSYILANATNAETTGSPIIDFCANGFKMKATDRNEDGAEYVYIAFAEAPLVNSNGVPCNAR